MEAKMVADNLFVNGFRERKRQKDKNKKRQKKINKKKKK